MPLVMSTVVGVLVETRTPREGEESWVRSRIAQSVLVPPTSTPMRYIVCGGLDDCYKTGFLSSKTKSRTCISFIQ